MTGQFLPDAYENKKPPQFNCGGLFFYVKQIQAAYVC